MQGLDHTRAVPDPTLTRVDTAVREQLAAVPAPTLTFTAPVLHREAVVIRPTDPRPLIRIRDAIRAVADACSVISSSIASAILPSEAPDRRRRS